jgi:hypothetical protein
MSTNWKPEDVSRMVINPFYAINFSERLFGEHPAIVPKEQWVQANVKLIGEMGTEAWLKTLLSVLEGNFP